MNTEQNVLACIYSVESEPFAKLLSLIKDGKRVYVCTGDDFQAYIIYKRLCELFPDKRITVFTCEDRGDLTEFLANPDTFLQTLQIDVLIASPVITTSLLTFDVTPKGLIIAKGKNRVGAQVKIKYFDAIVGFFDNTLTGVIIDQILKVLPPLPLYLYLKEDQKLDAQKLETEEVMKKMQTVSFDNKKLANWVGFSFSPVELSDQDILNIRQMAEKRVNALDRNFMYESLEGFGWHVLFMYVVINEDDRTERKAKSRLKKEFYEEHKQNILNARDLTEEEKQNLIKTDNLQKADVAALRRYGLKNLFEIRDPSEITPQLVDTFFNYSSKIYNIKLLLSPCRIEQAYFEEIRDNKPLSEREFPFTRAMLLFRALKAAGISWKKGSKYFRLLIKKKQGFTAKDCQNFIDSFQFDQILTLGELQKERPINIVRSILQEIGIKFKVDSKNERFFVDESDVEWVNSYAQWFEERTQRSKEFKEVSDSELMDRFLLEIT